MQYKGAGENGSAELNGSAATNGVAAASGTPGKATAGALAKPESAQAHVVDPYKDLSPFGRKLHGIFASNDDVSCKDTAKVPTLLELAAEVGR